MAKRMKRGFSMDNLMNQEAMEVIGTRFPRMCVDGMKGLVEEIDEMYKEAQMLQKEYSKNYVEWLVKRDQKLSDIKAYIEDINDGVRSFKSPTSGYSGDCGPQVIAMVTGMRLDVVISDMEYADYFEDASNFGTHPHHVKRTLEFYEVIESDVNFRKITNIENINVTSIIGVIGHWLLLVVKDGDRFILDPQYPKKKRWDFNRIGRLVSYLPLSIYKVN